jgi:ABC-type antimicrobial peptide transport system permease subunit
MVTSAAGAQDRFEVVGQVVLPGLSNYVASDQAALGVGALFTDGGLGMIRGVDATGAGVTAVGTLVTLRRGASFDEFSAAVTERFGSDGFDVAASKEPADVASYRRIRATPLVLAALLGVLAAVTVAHALVVSVHRRRMDLAVLRSMGFTPSQVSRAIAWQATTVAVIAAGVGIPTGIIVGRVAWSSVARQLGVVNEPVVPIVVLMSLPVAIVFANLVAVVPGWRAARLRPTELLRAE